MTRIVHAHALRISTNLSLDAAMVEEAKTLGVNLSRAAEDGIAAALKTERQRRWREENREAINAANAWVDKHGLPLEKYRLF